MYGLGVQVSLIMYRVSYIITLTSSVNSFTELQATLVSELGYHVSIHFKRVEFELSMYYCISLYVYIYIYIYIYIIKYI